MVGGVGASCQQYMDHVFSVRVVQGPPIGCIDGHWERCAENAGLITHLSDTIFPFM